MGPMLQHDPPSTGELPGARCARHVESPATSICTRCGSYACALCSHEGADGQEYCERCMNVRPPSVLAEPGTRLIAYIVDQLAFVAPILGCILFAAMLSAGTGMDDTVLGFFVLLGGMVTLGVLGYQLYLLSSFGQTIGKRMLGIRIVRNDGSRASLGRIFLLRILVPAAINAGCGLFGLVDALFIFAADRRCVHDHLADTKVVRVESYPG